MQVHSSICGYEYITLEARYVGLYNVKYCKSRAHYHTLICFDGIFQIEDVASEKLEKQTTQRAASEPIVTVKEQEQTMGSQAGVVYLLQILTHFLS